MLEARLHIYKKEKAFLEATILRIKRFEEILEKTDDDSLVIIFGTNYGAVEVGMPKALKISKPEETELIKKEVCRETINNWIKDDKNRIALLQLEIEQIDAALKSLTSEELYVIDKKYFEKWSWGKIEKGINEDLRKDYNDGYIGESGLKKIKNRSLGKLEFILDKFYKKVGKSI